MDTFNQSFRIFFQEFRQLFLLSNNGLPFSAHLILQPAYGSQNTLKSAPARPASQPRQSKGLRTESEIVSELVASFVAEPVSPPLIFESVETESAHDPRALSAADLRDMKRICAANGETERLCLFLAYERLVAGIQLLYTDLEARMYLEASLQQDLLWVRLFFVWDAQAASKHDGCKLSALSA